MGKTRRRVLPGLVLALFLLALLPLKAAALSRPALDQVGWWHRKPQVPPHVKKPHRPKPHNKHRTTYRT